MPCHGGKRGAITRQGGDKNDGEDDEVTSPVKKVDTPRSASGQVVKRLALEEGKEVEGREKVLKDAESVKTAAGGGSVVAIPREETDVNRALLAMHVDQCGSIRGEEKKASVSSGKKSGTYKKLDRSRKASGDHYQTQITGKRRPADDAEMIEVAEGEKARAIDKKKSCSGGASSVGGNVLAEKQWKGIWNLNCPGKLKHFMWRFAHNSLALRKNLEHRGMQLDTKCVVCGRLDEDGSHLFFKCKYVKQLWRCLDMEDVRLALERADSAWEAVCFIMNLKESVQLKVINGLWHWWLERNRIREGERRRQAEELAYVVGRCTEEFIALNTKVGMLGERRREKWKRPASNKLKINSDGAFNAESGAGGWGFVIRDLDGDVVHAAAGRLEFVVDALQAEVMACLAGVKAACERGMGHVIVETDSLILTQATRTDSHRLVVTGGLIYDLKCSMQSSFISYDVVFIPR
ncbi:hypothetical protein C2845_PM07G05680 [Panicum miliaceum]|uniref:Reverse transcriptase zinc-binding domain-containing protein n=1 Tax=Panicum miliaceum TaxID=4540 RepID=A0A3L6ST19_PANMI|nr:hypothetical protein C2845_PM07G05680 [Panicum miliaceum]